MTRLQPHELGDVRHNPEGDSRTSQNTAFFRGSSSSMVTAGQIQFAPIQQANRGIFESGLPNIHNVVYSFPPTNYPDSNNHFFQYGSVFEPWQVPQAPSHAHVTNHFEFGPPNTLPNENSNPKPQRLQAHIREQLLRDINSSYKKKKEFVISPATVLPHYRAAISQSQFSQIQVDWLRGKVGFCRNRRIKWTPDIIQYIQIRRDEMPQEEKRVAIRIAMAELGIQSQKNLEKEIT